MIRTRVGYAGGEKAAPTYHDLGDHTEAIQIDFDPSVISYADLLEIFWAEHNPKAKVWSRQYAAFVFTHDERQARLARETAKALGDGVTTGIRAAGTFWRAEDYHQKYGLRRTGPLVEALVEHFGSDRAFVDSTAAARLNGLAGGHGDPARVKAELDLPADLLASIG